MMRVTTGSLKGRKLFHPKGIRPTQEKVRKALFDILGDISGVLFLELFAGSAAVGLEAVSRGASRALVVERDRESLAAIQKNVQACKASMSCEIMPLDADRAVQSLHKAGRKFDIIFLDPPYTLQVSGGGESPAKKTLQTLGAYDIVAPNGFIVVQHFKKDKLPETLGSLYLFKQPSYGDTLLSFYTKG